MMSDDFHPSDGLNREGRPFAISVGVSLSVHVTVVILLLLWSGAPVRTKAPAPLFTVDLQQVDRPPSLAPESVSAAAARQRPPDSPPKPKTEPRVKAPPKPEPAFRPPVKPKNTEAAPTLMQQSLQTIAPAPPPTAVPSERNRSAPRQEAATATDTRPPPQTVSEIPPVANAASLPRSAADAPRAQEDARQRYLAEIKNLVERHREYPLLARKSRMEGEVTVRARLARGGRLLQAQIENSSGRSLLDRAALRAVRQVANFPPVPAAISGDEIDLTIPIVYRLSP